MTNDYLFGYEAMIPVLEALGIDIGEKKFAIQRIQINVEIQRFPTVTLTVAPESTLFEDKEAIKAITACNVIIQEKGDCDHCRGTGFVPEMRIDEYEHVQPCPKCHGTGSLTPLTAPRKQIVPKEKPQGSTESTASAAKKDS